MSAAVVAAHFYFAPPPHAGVYAPRIDGALGTTFWTYWRWVLGPMPAAMAAVIAACVLALTVWGLRRRDSTALFGAAWFVITLAPYLPLPDHRMDYYLMVPSIGIAMVGAFAIARLGKFRPAPRVAIGLAMLVYTGSSLQASWTVTRWQHARGARVEDLVLGVDEVHQAAKGKIILLDGIDSDLFWSGVVDLPFRAIEIPSVYLAPGSEARIQAAPDLLSKYVLPQAIARRALAAERCRGVPLRRRDAAQRYGTSGPALDRGDSAVREHRGCGVRRLSGHRLAGGRECVPPHERRGDATHRRSARFAREPLSWSL